MASSRGATFQKEVPQPLPTSLSSLTNPPKSLEVFAYRAWDHELILTGKRPISMCLETEASLVAQLIRIHLQCRRPQFHSWVGKIPWRRDRLPTLVSSVSLVAQLMMNLPTMQETWVQSLGWEDSLEEGVATHASFLAWRIPWTEEPGGLQFMGLKRVRHD